MARIDIWVHGRGRGHATRCAAIATRLTRDGHELRAFAGADAVDMLADVLPTRAIDSLPARLRPRSVVRLVSRVREACREIAGRRPDVVVSDGDLPALVAARLCGVPSVAVGHGLVFATCERPRGLPRLPWWRESIKARVSSTGARRRVAVGFVGLPVRSHAAVLARASVPALERRARCDVVAYFRDGIDDATMAVIRRAAPDVRMFVARPAAGALPLDRAAFLSALGRARAVIASAGSQLIAECVAWGIPMLAVYAQSDDEQRLNAEMLARAGLGAACERDALDEATVRAFLADAPPAAAPVWRSPDAADAVARTCTELLAEVHA